MTTYREILPELWASRLYDSIRSKDGNVYSRSFFVKQQDICNRKVTDPDELPSNAIKKLIASKQCSYCETCVEFTPTSDGDHVVRRKMDNIVWCVPCCRSCNSSKGKKDLVDWWINFKGRNFSKLSTEVVGVFVRAKYRLLKKEGGLDEHVPEVYEKALSQVRESWEILTA